MPTSRRARARILKKLVRVAFVATSTLTSLVLAIAINIATGGNPPPIGPPAVWDNAWIVVGVLTVATLAGAAIDIRVPGSEKSDPNESISATIPRKRLAIPETIVSVQDLPPGILHFVNRQTELKTLRAFAAGESTDVVRPNIISLSGMPGVGKTALALSIAHELQDRFDSRVYVDLRGTEPTPATPQQVLYRVLERLGFYVPAEIDDLVSLSSIFRSAVAESSMLLLLDNAESEDQIRPLLVGSRKTFIVITSRRELPGLHEALSMSVQPFGRSSATELLTLIVGDDRARAEWADLGRIAERCGNLPLALAVVGARLRARPQWKLVSFLDRLDEKNRTLVEMDAGGKSVGAAFLASYEALTKYDGHVFRHASLAPGADFSVMIAGACSGDRDLLRVEGALERLADCHLLIPTVGGRYRYHDLVRVFARQLLSTHESRRALRQAQARCLGALLGRLREAARHVGGRPIGGAGRRPTTLTLHATTSERFNELSWLATEHASLVSAVLEAEEAGHPRQACELGLLLVPYLKYQSSFHDAVSVLQASSRAAASSGNSNALAMCQGSLGDILRLQGRTPEAIDALRSAVLTLSTASADQANRGEMLILLGHAYRQDFDLVASSAAYREAHSVFSLLSDDIQAWRAKSEEAFTDALNGSLEDGETSLDLASQALAGFSVGTTSVLRRRTWIQQHRGSVLRFGSNFDVAGPLHSSARDAFAELGDRHGEGYAELGIADVLWNAGDRYPIQENISRALELFRAIGHDRGILLAALMSAQSSGISSSDPLSRVTSSMGERMGSAGEFATFSARALLWHYGPRRAESYWGFARAALKDAGFTSPVEFETALSIIRGSRPTGVI